MRVFLAGATGAIGVRLVPLLLAAGHTVAGLTRSQPAVVEALGAEPVVCNAYDAAALAAAVRAFAPDVVLHELTDLPDELHELDASRAANRRVRTEGTRNLVAAAAGSKVVAQSTAFPAGTEEHERLVLDAGGVILRYGRWYGPGTWYVDELPPAPRVHIDTAARRTVAALTAAPGAVLEVTDEC